MESILYASCFAAVDTLQKVLQAACSLQNDNSNLNSNDDYSNKNNNKEHRSDLLHGGRRALTPVMQADSNLHQ